MTIKCIPEFWSTIGIEILPIPPLRRNWQEVRKCEIWCRFQHHSNLSLPRLKMQQDIQTLKQTSCVAVIALCTCEVWWCWLHAPWEPLGKRALSPKIVRWKRAKSSLTQPWIIQFSSNFVQSLNAWHRKCYKSSRSRGQRPWSQHKNRHR